MKLALKCKLEDFELHKVLLEMGRALLLHYTGHDLVVAVDLMVL